MTPTSISLRSSDAAYVARAAVAAVALGDDVPVLTTARFRLTDRFEDGEPGWRLEVVASDRYIATRTVLDLDQKDATRPGEVLVDADGLRWIIDTTRRSFLGKTRVGILADGPGARTLISCQRGDDLQTWRRDQLNADYPLIEKLFDRTRDADPAPLDEHGYQPLLLRRVLRIAKTTPDAPVRLRQAPAHDGKPGPLLVTIQARPNLLLEALVQPKGASA